MPPALPSLVQAHQPLYFIVVPCLAVPCPAPCQHVISRPDVVDVELEGSDEFILLASDGLWDVFPPQEAVNFVRAAVQEGAQGWGSGGRAVDLDAVCERLVAAALARGTVDNVSVIVVAIAHE